MNELGRKSVFLAALLLAASPLAAQTPPYVGTIVVGGAGAPLVNGANLVNALTAIPAPGPTNRWLVKVEPGIFDIGTLALVLRDYVDIEGSGRTVTKITSIKAESSAVVDPVSGSTISSVGATVFALPGIHAELRELSVENKCTNFSGIGVYVLSSSVLLSRIHVDVETPVAANGIALGNNPRLNEVSVRAQCTWNHLANAVSTGISIINGSPSLQDVVITTEGSAVGVHRGLFAQDSSPRLDRLRIQAPLNPGSGFYTEGISLVSTLTSGPVLVPQILNSEIRVGATGSGSQAYGVRASGSFLGAEIRNTAVKALNASYAAGAVALSGAIIDIATSSLSGQGTIGVGVHSGSPGGAVRVNQSTSAGSTRPYSNPSGNISFGASQLIGASPLDPGVVCASSFDGSYNPLNGPC